MSCLTTPFAQFYALIYRILKWLEVATYYLFFYFVNRMVQDNLEEMGIFFHFSETNTQSDEKKVRSLSKYKDLIHVTVNRRKKLFCNLAATLVMGLGEGFMDGDWECESKDLQEISRRTFRNKTHLVFFNPWNRFLYYMYFQLVNMQTVKRAWIVGKEHYDIGNELFQSFLDPFMNYTCGYWATAKTLNESQIHKMELIAKKLELRPGMRVLDIGCGWGGMCKFFAENYGVEMVGITISNEGAKYARELCDGLPVEIKVQDYRSLEGQFDRVVSVGMFEHVGQHNYRTYFKVVNRVLKDDGIFLLHCIGRSHLTTPRVDVFVHTYIFPNGSLPHHSDIAKQISGLFVLEDWHNFGPDYGRTLEAWWENFELNWPKIADKYDQRFYKMFEFYLRTSKGLFTSRALQLFQVVLTKDGLDQYRAAR